MLFAAMKQVLCAVGFLFVSSLAIATEVYTVKTVPNPKVTNNSYVSDPAHLLEDSTVENINYQLAYLENLTTDQVAVVVLPSIGEESPKDFAVDLFARFKVGQKYKENGLLVLLVMDQKRVEFETGYGLEGMLPDVICKRIQTEHMIPRFKEGNYNQGLIDGVNVVVGILGSSDFRTEFLEEKEEAINTYELTNAFALALSIPYLIFMTIVFFVKRSNGSFSETYPHVSRNKQRRVFLTIPMWRWCLVYIGIPCLFYVYIRQYAGPYPLLVLFVGVYLLILVMFVDRKQRCRKAYVSSYEPGDYYAKYNSHLKYFDNWGIAAVFFPIPFLFTDWKNKKRLQIIRKHERNCQQCNATMHLLTEKEEDAYLKDNQQLEEQIKSVDYDVWVCDNCHAYQALAYYTKESKYSACSNCGTKAYYLKSDVILKSATYEHSGKGKRSYMCMYCKHEHDETYKIDQLSSSSSDSGSSGSSGGSSSSSFGGGSSGGGGSGSSW